MSRYTLKHIPVLLLLVTLSIMIAHGSASAQTSDDPAEPPIFDIPFTLLGVDTLQLNGMYGRSTLWMPFQSNWFIGDDLVLTVDYIASPLLNVRRSSLTILANGVEVGSIRPIGDGRLNQFNVTIPANLLMGAGINLEFQSFLRLTDEACEETNNPGQWVQILGSSFASLSPDTTADYQRLENLPQAIVLQNAYADVPPVVFLLPTQLTSTVRDTAAQVAQRLGTIANDAHLPFRVMLSDNLDEAVLADANVVVIGLADDLPVDVAQGRFVTAEGDETPPEHGVLQMMPSPWNPERALLLVSANGDEGLLLAGAAFSHTATFDAMTGTTVFIKNLREAPNPPRNWQSSPTTWMQLGGFDQTISGTGMFNAFYFFQRPLGQLLHEGATLNLNISASPALQAPDSYITVLIDNEYVGHVAIGGGIANQWVSLPLPVEALNRASLTTTQPTMVVQLVVANFVSETICQQSYPQAAWTTISAESYFDLSFESRPLPDLQAFPYPFVDEVPTILVFPDDPTDEELGAALSLSAVLPSAQLTLIPASAFTTQSHPEGHVILLGTIDRQPHLEAFFVGLDVDLYQQSADMPETGILAQTLTDDGRVVLMVYGVTYAHFEEALQALISTNTPINQTGSVGLVRAGSPVQMIARAVDPLRDITLDTPSDTSSQQPIIPEPEPWLVITIILVLTAFILVGLVGFSTRKQS